MEDHNMSDLADLDSYISTHMVLHLHLESRMLWKKLVQFEKGFLLIKKKNLLQPICP